MKILIVGGGFVNKGAEAMVKTVQTELGKRIPDATFHVQGYPTEDWAFLESEGIQPLPSLGRNAKLRRLVTLCGTHPSLAFHLPAHRHFGQAVTVAQIDAIVDVSGYAYGDPWGTASANLRADMVAFARDLRKPYVFLPQAWGPFQNAELAKVVHRICSQASMVYARDDRSMADLALLFGQRLPPTVQLSPDIAFLFEKNLPPSPSTGLQSHLVDQNTPTAGVAPNMRIYEKTEGTGADNRYLRFLVTVCTTLVSYGFRVLLLPHEVARKNTGSIDDRLLCSIIENAVQDNRVTALVHRMSSSEIKQQIGSMQCLVGSRFHALVAALSQGIPSFAVSWSHKYKELLRSAGLDRYVIEYEDISSPSLELNLLTDFLGQLPSLKLQVDSALPGIKRHVERTFDSTAAILQNQNFPR